MRRACTALAVILLPALLAPAAAAEIPKEAARQKMELQNIREEIKRQESALSQRKRDEKAATDYLAKLDREIDISHAYLKELNGDVERLAQQVEVRSQRVRLLAAEKDTLASFVKKRLVSFYKHGRAQEIDLLLSIRSLQQAQVWMRYQKMIADADRRNLQSLALRQQQLEKEAIYLRQERADKAKVLNERTAEEQALRRSREKRSAYLLTVRKDKKILEQRLRDSRASEKQILALITKAEQARLSASARKPQQPSATVTAPVVYSGRFAGMKGRLTWPVRGAVVSRFGRQRHPELNTITENLGIDIKAREGGTVVAVGDGRIQTITWQRGSGNIVIISHGDGFYTVYTHLEEIRVSQDDPVRQGQAIGTVGESGSFNGSVLHFQIWKNTRNLDPEEWLG
ncbi:MAG TPA: peptidoglycan DD-metalloendopeptidase family protein [bacterium]|nr:peptidoglycan DD-metalloendopeptidase family protein [bacterium]HQG44869.1 peptidoglycan DD-metalloendopeptidase family protein [bacterium]HQI47393.1 peptidoglycan DD-metalloendopeptidase family protein [bacterium]HQJ63005.1 peptidoglycan DD-metalloendopeptidase family protein [bacterium]